MITMMMNFEIMLESKYSKCAVRIYHQVLKETTIETFIVRMLLLKNLQFSPNDYETWSKLSTHGYLILREFHNHWVKIEDFLIKAYVL